MSKFTLELPEEIETLLHNVSRKGNISKSEALDRAFALLSIAAEAEEKEGGDYSIGIVRKNPETNDLEAVSRVVNLYRAKGGTAGVPNERSE